MSDGKDVKLDLSALKRFADSIHRGLSNGSGPILKAMKQWAARYRSFAQERFDVFSKGGGDWPDLEPSTKRARRKGKSKKIKGLHGAAKKTHEAKMKRGGGGGTFSILRDKGILFGALDTAFTNKPGALEESIPFGVRVGYGGSRRHPGGQTTIFDIARFHQEGRGRLPVRRIIVEPDQQTVDAMAGDMLRAINELRRDSER
jgi:hypothetical protein